MQFFKKMNQTKKKLFFIIYIAAASVFFLYVLFPSDTVKKRIAYNLSSIDPNLSISIDSVNPVFPPAILLKEARFHYINNLLLDVEKLKIAIGFLSVFSADKTYTFKGSSYDGIIKGKGAIGAGDSNGKVKIDANFSKIQIKDIPAIKNLSSNEKFNYKISGILDGKVTYSNNKGSDSTLNAKLGISKCKIALKEPVFNYRDFNFSSIEAEITTKNKKMRFKHCTLNGDKADVSLSGFITLKKNPGKSVLNLKGKIKLKPIFFENMGKDLPANLFLKKRSAQDGFSFKIDGTFDRPNFTLE